MLHVEPHIANLVRYVPGKPVEELKRELGLEHIVKLASNENPLGPSPLAVEAIRAAIDRMHFYPDGGAFYLKEALALKLGVRSDEILTANGSNEAIELVIRTFARPGCNAVLSASSFVVYRLVCQAMDIKVREVPLNAGLGFDLDAMAASMDENTRFTFIGNPNNPTGTYVSREALEGFLDRVPEHVVVGLDEAYFEFVSKPDYPDGLSLRGQHPNLVIFRTFSKCYGLAGVRVGYAIARPEVAGYLNSVRAPFNCSGLAQVAAIAAIGDDAFVERVVAHNARGLETLCAGLEALGLDYVDSVANFVLVRVPGKASEIYDELLKLGMIVRPMAGYGLPEHIRVSVGLEDEIAFFLASIERVLQERRQP